MDQKGAITIISVYHNWLSKKLLEMNLELAEKMNPETRWEWLVGDNTRDDFKDKINGTKFKVIYNPDRWNGLGAHQHSAAINRCLREVKTRFVLSMDGDCFIVRKNWIRDVIAYMQKKNLSFFGLSFHPKAYANYRYFPTEVFMAVDLEKISVETLDFMPHLEINEEGKVDWGVKNVPFEEKTVMQRAGKRVFSAGFVSGAGKLKRMFDMSERRKNIGTVHDTGYGVYSLYYGRATSECAVSVYNPYRDSFHAMKVFPRLNAWFEKLLPDSLCYVPKKAGCTSEIGFQELGYYDCVGQGWEEYLWQGSPFAVHLRGVKTHKRKRTPEEEVERVKHALDNIVHLL